MNNLDELASFSTLDSQNMLAQIDSLPDQLQAGWEQAQELSLPAWPDIRHVLIAGMGGAAVSAELLAAATAHQCRAPIFIHRNYGTARARPDLKHQPRDRSTKPGYRHLVCPLTI